jgi:hypothetical protein
LTTAAATMTGAQLGCRLPNGQFFCCIGLANLANSRRLHHVTVLWVLFRAPLN